MLAASARYDWPMSPMGVMQDAFTDTADDMQYKGQSTYLENPGRTAGMLSSIQENSSEVYMNLGSAQTEPTFGTLSQPSSMFRLDIFRSTLSKADERQSNSILQHATINGTNYYSSNFHGPPELGWTMAGALASLDVLTVAIAPAQASDPTSSPTGASGTSGSPLSTGGPSPSPSYVRISW